MAKPNLRQILADNVKRYRARVGVSQDNFAIECGVHRTYVGQVERCERNISLATLELFANAMSVSVPQLLTKDGVK
ncbi:MAG: helix-turn-helix transcriptional regulator [Verrucomicrobiaceae bacterium]|nr:helix-turn-helix transcriptional regulator [Verrucomicrobiaceae bacterium]